MADDGTVWIWTTAILALSVGFAAGFLVAYLAVLRDKDAAGLREELTRQKEEHEAYRGRVDEHFVQTSALFQDMTKQYGALYQHLAQGAQSLCSDRLVTHQPSVPESAPMVEHKAAGDPGIGSSRADAVTEPAPAAEPAPTQTQPQNQPQTPPESEIETASSAPRPAAASELEESEMEGFAPRPEAEHLRKPAPTAAEEQAEAATAEDAAKARLH